VRRECGLTVDVVVDGVGDGDGCSARKRSFYATTVWSPRADASRHFAIARGSAMECAAVLDVMRVLGILPEQPHQRAIGLLARLVAMLTKMCRLRTT
jgi:hypothetical protein